MDAETISVLMLARNHGPFIRQAIESVLAQRCDRPFLLWIGEDASTDETPAICLDMQARHPDRIRVLSSAAPLGMHGNFARLWAASPGGFIAFCEGDDYWRDPLKLQKQSEYLERNSDCSFCGMFTDILSQGPNGEWRVSGQVRPPVLQEKYSFAELIPFYGFHFSSVMLRRNAVDFPDWFPTVYCVDRPLYLLAAQRGLAGLIPEATSVYRLHPGGAWSTLDASGKATRSIQLFGTMKAGFPPRYGRIFDRTLGNILWSYVGEAVRQNDRHGVRTVYGQSLRYLSAGHVARHFKNHAGIWLRLAQGPFRLDCGRPAVPSASGPLAR